MPASSLTTSSQAPHSLGKTDAAVTLEEFGDFQCPPCAALAEPINRLQRDYPNGVRIIFREFPLVNHAHAREAALAAEAAGLQNRFWEMHDLLYREQSAWSSAADAQALFRSYAGTIGLDLKRFDRDLEGDVVKKRVEEDQKQAASLGISTTPSILVNKKSVPPASLRPDLLRKVVEQTLASIR